MAEGRFNPLDPLGLFRERSNPTRKLKDWTVDFGSWNVTAPTREAAIEQVMKRFREGERPPIDQVLEG